MVEKSVTICDACGGTIGEGYDLPKGSLDVRERRGNLGSSDHHHFCGKECLVQWLQKPQVTVVQKMAAVLEGRWLRK